MGRQGETMVFACRDTTRSHEGTQVLCVSLWAVLLTHT